jgi:hypothetical protein
MSHVVVYSSDYCPYCMRAKYLLENKGVAFEEIKVDGKPRFAPKWPEGWPYLGAADLDRQPTSVDAMTSMPWSAPASSTRCWRPECTP